MLVSDVDFASVATFLGIPHDANDANDAKRENVANASNASCHSSAESSTSFAEVAKALAFTTKPCSSGAVLSGAALSDKTISDKTESGENRLEERLSEVSDIFSEFGNFNDPEGPKLVSVTQCLLNKPSSSGRFGRAKTIDTDLVAFARANPDSSGNSGNSDGASPQGYIARTQPLMTNKFTGKPLRCIHCGRWQHKAGSAYWVGECRICHEAKVGNAVCTVMAVDWLGERGYV